MFLRVLELMIKGSLFRRSSRDLTLEVNYGVLELSDGLFLSRDLSLKTPFHLLGFLQQFVLLLDGPLGHLGLSVDSFLGPHGSKEFVVGFGFLARQPS